MYTCKRFPTLDIRAMLAHGPGAFTWATTIIDEYEIMVLLLPDSDTRLRLARMTLKKGHSNPPLMIHGWNGDKDTPTVYGSIPNRPKGEQSTWKGWLHEGRLTTTNPHSNPITS